MATRTETVKAAVVQTPPDPSTHLVKNLVLRKDEIVAALASPYFYIQLLVVGTAVAIALLMAFLIRRRLTNHFKAHPPRKIDVEFILKPLSLLGPLLALLYLSIVKPLSDQYAADGDLTYPLTELLIAYVLAKSVVMIV